MKRFFLFYMACLIATLSVGQSTHHYTLTNNISDYQLITSNGTTEIQSSVKELVSVTNQSRPNLPSYVIELLQPANSEIDHITINRVDSIWAENITMEKALPVIIGNVMTTTSDYPLKKYPSSVTQLGRTRHFRSFLIADLYVCPFTYDAVQKRLYFSNKIDFTVTYKQKENKSLSHILNYEDCKEYCLKHAFNKEELDLFYPDAENTPNDAVQASSNYINSDIYNRTRYLIITSDSLKDCFQRLADWKTEKGYIANVVTIQQIKDLNFPSDKTTLPQKIKHFLARFIPGKTSFWGLPDNHAQTIKYVLLGADADTIPPYLWEAPHLLNTSNDIIPTDFYYACHNDMKYEWGDDNTFDLTPSFSIGRVPVRTKEEANAFINKVLTYEQKGWNPSGSYQVGAKRMIYLGATLNNKKTSEIGDARLWCEEQFSELQEINNDLIKGKTYYDAKDTTINNKDTLSYVHMDSIKALNTILDRGQFVTLAGHGSYNRHHNSGFLGNGSSFFSADQASNMHSPYFKIISSMACEVNKFNMPSLNDCELMSVGEALLRNESNKVLAFVGNTWFGISKNRKKEKGKEYSLDLLTDFYENLLAKDNIKKYMRIGDALAHSNVKGLYSTLIKLSFNLVGDPEMPVFTDNVKKFTDIPYQYIRHDIVSINMPIVRDSLRINIFSYGGSYYNNRDNFDSRYNNLNAYIPTQKESVQVCITAPNYLPIRKIFYKNLSFDNTVISDSAIRHGHDIKISTTSENVTVENGNAVFKADNQLVIGRDFECKSGAGLSLQLFENKPF